ncbi:MAG TPA: methyltransferase domain-containing protein [Capillimicrobium sp.]
MNVGAGAGSYEPRDLDVVAVEPSAVMAAQRPPGAAPVIAARAEALPFADGAFDAAMAVLTDHHWDDRVGGLRELRRVARRAVVVTFDPAWADAYWAVRDYLPGFRALPGLAIEEIASALGPGARVEPLPVPADCEDGFFLAWWKRPEALLEPEVRQAISVFHRLDAEEVDAFARRLRADLASGAWAARNAELLELDELDLGLRLVVAG